MVADTETNFMYLADSLKKRHPAFYKLFEKVLTDCNISYAILPGTKDIWAVDYMPVQVRPDAFVQFRYNPDYLQSTKWLRSITDTDSICRAIGITPGKSSIVLDGGNVVRTADKVIMCDKVFAENPHISEKLLIKELKEELQIDQLFFIPTDPSDKIGHADGICRFLDDRTVLVNELSRENPWFRRAFRLALHNAGLDWMEIPYNPFGNQKLIQANGIYINFLQMKGAIVVPTFKIKEDDIAVKLIEQLFPESRIATVDSNEIAVHGGVLNCITWNIKKVQTE